MTSDATRSPSVPAQWGSAIGRTQPQDAVPSTLAQWRDALNVNSAAAGAADRSSPAKLMHGYVPEPAAGAVMELVRRYCEAAINRRTRRLRYELEDAGDDGDAVALVCTRYARFCEELLFFTGVEGMPRDSANQLAEQIREFVAGVLHTIAEDAADMSSDAGHYLRRLERRWIDG